MGCGSTGGLVRGLRRCGRRADQALRVFVAQYGQRGGVPLRLLERHATGLPGSSRTGLRLVRWGLSPAPVRQFERRREEDSARTAEGRDGTIYCFPLALAIRGRVLHAGGSPRERWDRVGGGLLPAEPLGAGAA